MMMKKTLLLALALQFAPPAGVLAEGWKAGVAKLDITPEKSLWMSGYSSRNRPAEGKLTDLWAKALVLEGPRGARAVLVTLDLIGLGRELSLAIRKDLRAKCGFELRQIALCASHTHTGPVVGRNLSAMYFLDEKQQQLIEEYAARLKNDIVTVVGRARDDLVAAKLSWGTGRATFAVNRRENRAGDVPRLRKEGKLKGPVDHDVPVLRVVSRGKLQAVVVGYACHATVLSFYQWSGDYAGFAQIELEQAHPGTVALFWAGCGADINPLPRRKVELAKEYGRELAQAVEAVLAAKMQPVRGRLGAVYEEIDLPFAELPTRKEIEANAKSTNRYEASRARLLLDQLDREGALPKTYPYPIQTWRLGSEVLFVTLGGEVVVDFALRLKKELGPGSTWVAAYTNDVMGYIPSRRVLAEGGYEGGGAMVYYGLPTVWDPAVEDLVVQTVHRQAKKLGGR